MKYLHTFFFAILFGFSTFAQQNISVSDLRVLQKKEDSLKLLSRKLIDASNIKDRMEADSMFTKVFVRALLVKNSFNFAFDSVSMSRLASPDGNFKIFTWNLNISDNLNRQRGAIQMKTPDGSLKLFPLIDKSDVIESPIDTITDNKNWVGALYYKILKNSVPGKDYYTLIGLDEFDRSSNKKVVDVLSFDEAGKPVFGANIFQTFKDDPFTNGSKVARYIIEYKKEAAPKLNFDATENAIVVERLASETNEPKKKWTYIPDGSFNGFRWKDNRWVYEENLVKFIPSTTAPIPNPLRNKDGNIDETKFKPSEK